MHLGTLNHKGKLSIFMSWLNGVNTKQNSLLLIMLSDACMCILVFFFISFSSPPSKFKDFHLLPIKNH